MTSGPSLTRRQFARFTAAAGSLLLPGLRGWAAEPAALAGAELATDHFWYRLAPAGPYVDSQRGNKAFGFTDGTILLSEDNGRTWPYRSPFPDAQQITFSYILKNGNVLFATGAQLYVSTDNLQTYRPVTVKQADGSDYLPHTPANPDHPGWYFHSLTGVSAWEVNSVELLVWGNYCNVLGGATPVNVYYSADGGQTVKIAYAFGQNPYYRDNGSPGGGSTGTLLGDPGNPVICRHVHCVAYNPAENAFYACTGDADKAEGHECHWLRGTYDAGQDRWQWTVVVSASSNSRYKCGGINFVAGQAYWIADANGPLPHDRGVFRCAPADIAHPDKHATVQPGIRVRQHAHPGQRNPGRPLRHRLALHQRDHHFSGPGQDLGPIRPAGIRQAFRDADPSAEQRRLVPHGLAFGLDFAGRGDVP